MAVYEPDSSATAVILCKLTDVSYKWGIESFRLVSEYKVKIKVLKPEGTSYADVTIPYYELPNNAMKENIIGLDASAYNLENGKIVRTKMKRDVVFKERVGESRMNLKFSIPQVKAGTLIEYEYRIESDFFFSIDSWKAQSDIHTRVFQIQHRDARCGKAGNRKRKRFPQLIHRIAIAPMLRDASELPGQPTPRFERRQSCVVRG